MQTYLTPLSDSEVCVGLFSGMGHPNAEIRDLGLIDPEVNGAGGDGIGALAGQLEAGTIRGCYVAGGVVRGEHGVGGLVGATANSMWGTDSARVVGCHSICDVVGTSSVGGLVGSSRGLIADCYARSVVTGEETVGGLVGSGYTLTGCYADGIVTGERYVGGLIGSSGSATNCYAQGTVIGNEWVGGLAGYYGSMTNCYATAVVLGDAYTGGLMGGGTERYTVASFWDVEASRQQSSAGGAGKSTEQMQQIGTYRAWGDGDSAGVWTIDDGNDYPRLAWEGRPGVPIGAVAMADVAGAGTADDPYLIYRAAELEAIAGEPNEWGRHFKLMADIDLMAYPGVDFNGGPDGWHAFTGVFDGNGHTISNFTYRSDGWGSAGFFGYVESPCARSTRGGVECDPNATGGVIKNLGLLNPVIDGRLEHQAGGLVGHLDMGTVCNCYVEGGLVLGGREETGGLVGGSYGTVRGCYVVGATVIGTWGTGGVIGGNVGDVRDCYGICTVIGETYVGGLVGDNFGRGPITNCFAAGRVVGTAEVGGLLGANEGGVTASFWDADVSGQAGSAGGTGLTTAEMMGAGVFLEAGWDFVGEVENGVEDIWWILEGEGYPRLWWEASDDG